MHFVMGPIVTTELQAQGLSGYKGSTCFSKTESWNADRSPLTAPDRFLSSVALGQWFSNCVSRNLRGVSMEVSP